jgi:outer membrane lipoprotein-sorting protein
MTIGRRGFVAGVAASLVAPAIARAEASELDKLLVAIAEARASLKTLTGPFVQERMIGLLSAKVKSNGTLTLVRPDRLRWELAPPDDIVYWVTPDGLAYRSKRGEGHVGAGQARIAAALDDLRTVLGGDLQALRARYDLRLAGELTFEATPREPSPAHLEKIAFALAADKVTPVRVELVEGPRDRTIIKFGALQRDLAIDPARMRPPK